MCLQVDGSFEFVVYSFFEPGIYSVIKLFLRRTLVLLFFIELLPKRRLK